MSSYVPLAPSNLGKALIMLTRLDFIRRAPDSGDVLFNVLQHLRHEDKTPAVLENNSTFCPRDMLPDSGTELDVSCPDEDGACPLLWEFLYQRLQDTDWSEVICWESPEQFTFRILKPDDLATAWGKQKHRSNMNYEKMSRAMRDYYKRNIIKRVIGKTLTFQFLQNPALIQKCRRGARPHSKERPTSEITKTETRSPDSSTLSPATTKAETRSPDSSTLSPSTTTSASPNAVERIYNDHGRTMTPSSIASHSPVEKLYNAHRSNVTPSLVVSPRPVGQLNNAHVTQSSIVPPSPVGQLNNAHVTQSSIVPPSPVELLYNAHPCNVAQSSVVSPSPVGQLYNAHGRTVTQSSTALHAPIRQSPDYHDNTVTSPIQYITVEKPSDCFESSTMLPNCQRSSFDSLATHEKFAVHGDYVTILKTENTDKSDIVNRGHSFNQIRHPCMEMCTADRKYYSKISRSPTQHHSCDSYRDGVEHQHHSAYQMPHKQKENRSIVFQTTSHTVPCIAVVNPSRFIDTDSACSVLDKGRAACTCIETSPSQREAFPDQTDDADWCFNSNTVYRYPHQSMKRFKSLSPATERNKYHTNNNSYQPRDIQYTHFSPQRTPDSTSQPLYISEQQRQRDIYVSCSSSLEHPKMTQLRKLPHADQQCPTESRWYHFTQHENTPCYTSGSDVQNSNENSQSQPEDLSMKHRG